MNPEEPSNQPDVYYNRGLAKAELGNLQDAISDWSESIRLNPSYASAYYNRGIAKDDLGDKYGSLADLRKSAQLYQQQGNNKQLQNVLKEINKIERSL